jgi:hypothetical protein
MNKQNEFSTNDQGLAVTLITLKYELLKLGKSSSKKVRLGFKHEKNIEKVVEDYFNNKIKLPALSLFNHQKNLKSRIYSCNQTE